MTDTAVKIGFTGHQGLNTQSRHLIEAELRRELKLLGSIEGYCSLAKGADQIFARCIVELQSKLTVIIPCEEYRTTFTSEATLSAYDELLCRASCKIDLDFIKPSEQAFWSAGKRVVQESSLLLAVWDGQPAGGLGGTADVVQYARHKNVPTHIIWPSGASR
jgi:hypothetical protein